MLDDAQLKDAIGKLKYKPGWEFSFRDTEWGKLLDIQATVPHSVTLEPATFLFTRCIPSWTTTGQFVGWVKAVLAEAEMHEMREFLRFDGVLVDDPHAALAV
jgi:hypothetical protein